MKNETELGKEANIYMQKGELVPDSITVKMLEERLLQKDVEQGAILDGFPRTEAQAIALKEMLLKLNKKVDMALNIEVDFNEIIARIANRRSCKNCPAIYNIVFNPPKVENTCDECGGELYQREDQKPEVVENRLQVYSKSAEELIKFYQNEGVLNTKQAGDTVGKNSYDVAKEVEEYLKNIN